MPSTVVLPKDSRHFDGRPQGYVVRVSKTVFNHPVRFIAKDDGGTIIAEGTVPQNQPFREFLVRQNVGFDIINVGEWNMDVGWPQVQVQGAVGTTELDQVIAGLPWAGDLIFGSGVDAITGGASGSAIKAFKPEINTGKTSSESFRLIQDDSDLEREIEASASGKYNIEGIKVSVSTSYLQKIKISELSFTLIAEYESEINKYDEADTYLLTDQARDLIYEPEKFRKAYGDYFVSGGKRSSRFIATYSCQSTSVKSMDEFKASFSGEAPEVFSAEGSVRFMQSASKYNIQMSVDLTMEGYKGASPGAPWTPEKIVEALAWFKANEQGIYLQAKLKHYSTIDPRYPRTINVAPAIFVELRQLYSKVWDIRSRNDSVPEYYQQQYKEAFRALTYGVEASQHELATDLAKRQDFQQKADILLSDYNDVFARMDFYQKVKNIVGGEPPEGHVINEGTGRQVWNYGFDVYSKSPAVVIHQTTLAYRDTWRLGWREKTLEFGPDGKYLMVGWNVVSNWGDGTNGAWYKAVDQILLTDHAAVHVRSLYDRGCDWSLVLYYVDSKDYQFQ